VRVRTPLVATPSGDRALRIGVTICAMLISVVAVVVYGGGAPGAPSSDSWVYLAAGERLNAGHPLYALSPGDRPVELMPPYWSAPLLSPPPIAVVWRPLALLGEPAMFLWWGACMAASAWLLARMLRLARPLELVLVAAIAPFVAVNAWSGNANALLIPLLVVTYSSGVGVAVAAAAAVKLGPVLLMPWVFVTRRREVTVAVVAGALIGAVSIIGAGMDSWIDWLRVIPESAPSPQSIAGTFGIPPALVVLACGIAAAVAAVILRDRPRASFAVACLLVVAATPALYVQGWALLAAPLAIGASLVSSTLVGAES
jgi:hypothetical protein